MLANQTFEFADRRAEKEASLRRDEERLACGEHVDKQFLQRARPQPYETDRAPPAARDTGFRRTNWGTKRVRTLAMRRSSTWSRFARSLAPARLHYRNEWMLHPYFDTVAKTNVWEVRVVPPYPAAAFEAAPCAAHPPSVQTRIAFHLKFVLGEQFQRFCTHAWATLPQVIRDSSSAAGVNSVAEVKSELGKLLRYYVVSMGANGWQSALHRGLIDDAPAQHYLAAQAKQAPGPNI